MTERYDLVVIGAGSGGVRAARCAAETGAQVAVVERDRPGGTCVLRGCIPKKLMVYAAGYAGVPEQAAGYGWSHEVAPRYDHGRFVATMQAELTRLSGLYADRLAGAGVDLIEDEACFVDDRRVGLVRSGREIEAEHILIATGGQPRRGLGISGSEHAITSDEFFTLASLPSSAAVIGGGYIAVELAGIMGALGVRTSLIYRGDTILRGFDDDVRQQVQANLRAGGVEIVTNATPRSIAPDGVELSTAGRIDCETTVIAIGRDPATRALKAGRAGLRLAEDGSIPVDGQGCTAVAGISAIGDVTNRVNLTPVAIGEAEAFVRRQFGGDGSSRFRYEYIPTAVFSMPPAASVGLTEQEARRRGHSIRVHMTRFRPLVHTLSGSDRQMLVKLVVAQRDDRVLGCHIVGDDAAEIIQATAIAVTMGATKADFDRTCALHPTSAEELVTLS